MQRRAWSYQLITLQHKKLGNINCYLDLFHHKGVFVRQGLINQIASQSEPLERATLLQGQCPQNGWLLKAILPCRETGVSGEKVIAHLLSLSCCVAWSCCLASIDAFLAALIASSQYSSCSPDDDSGSRLTSIIQWSSSNRPAAPKSICSLISLCIASFRAVARDPADFLLWICTLHYNHCLCVASSSFSTRPFAHRSGEVLVPKWIWYCCWIRRIWWEIIPSINCRHPI